MRQWDTKKAFKPRYALVASIVFLGWLKAFTHPSWKRLFGELWAGLFGITAALFGIVLGFLLLALSPIAFPALCLFEVKNTRRRRLQYLRANRRADEDV